MNINENSGESLPLTHEKDETFVVEIPHKYEGEAKEQVKTDVSEGGERTPAGEAEEQRAEPAVADKTYEPCLWLAICRTYFKPFAVGAFFKLIHDTLVFVSPLLLKYVFVSFYSLYTVHITHSQ